MSDQVEGQEGQENVQQEEKKYSEVEQQAMEQGWAPKEEFQGDPAKWVEAGEFIRRGELFSKIENQSREIKDVRKALHNLQEHYTKVKEVEYNRALSALKKEFKLANREGDFDRADQLESEIESVTREAESFKQEASQVVQEAAAIHPEFAAWVERNTWYTNQPHMQTFADIEGKRLKESGLAPKEVLKKVEEAVRKEFPNKFTNPNRERPGAVEGSTIKGTAVKETFELSEQERKVMNTLCAQKGPDGKPFMTKEEYIADLKKIKGVR